jgi:hypothetical protein
MEISAAKNLVLSRECKKKKGIIYRNINSEERLLISDLVSGSYVYDNDYLSYSFNNYDLLNLKSQILNILDLIIMNSDESLLQTLQISPPLHELILILNYCLSSNRKILSCGSIFSHKIYNDLLSYFSFIAERSNLDIINTYQKLLDLFALSSRNGIITFYQ